MKRMLKRLEKLEAANQTASWGAWYVEQEELVERVAMSKMSPEDLVVLEEIFETPLSQRNVTELRSAVWKRWEKAFDETMKELSIPIAFLPSDRWA